MSKNGATVCKTDYPEHYKFWCCGYLGQVIASDCRKALFFAILDWPAEDGPYKIVENKVKQKEEE